MTPDLMDAHAVYVDMDDVLCHSTRAFLRLVERRLGRCVAYESLSTFDLGVSCGLSREELDTVFGMFHSSEELLKIPPIGENIETLRQWTSRGVEIAVVTGRPTRAIEASVAWLDSHRVAYHEFVVVDKYRRFVMDRRAVSLEEFSNRRFRLAIEDSLDMATFLADSMATPVALLDRPWNRNGTLHPRITRYTGYLPFDLLS